MKFNVEIDKKVYILGAMILLVGGLEGLYFIIGLALTIITTFCMFLLGWLTNGFKTNSMDTNASFVWGLFVSIVFYCWYLFIKSLV